MVCCEAGRPAECAGLVGTDATRLAESIVYGRQLASTTSGSSTEVREPAVTSDNRYSDSGSPWAPETILTRRRLRREGMRLSKVVSPRWRHILCVLRAAHPSKTVAFFAPSRARPSYSKPRPAGENRHNPIDLHRVGRLSKRMAAAEPSFLSRGPKSILATVLESRYTSRFVLTPFFRKQHSVDRPAEFNEYQNDFRSRYSDRGSGTQRWRHDLCLPRRSQHAAASGSDSPKRSYPDNSAST